MNEYKWEVVFVFGSTTITTTLYLTKDDVPAGGSMQEVAIRRAGGIITLDTGASICKADEVTASYMTMFDMREGDQ